jgi:hypothetical protein
MLLYQIFDIFEDMVKHYPRVYNYLGVHRVHQELKDVIHGFEKEAELEFEEEKVDWREEGGD